ncbi:glycosyltransferase [Tabrizicola sp.]|uniref:glycosyltransferase n=1 Tax=Tabrizicola sp. TaxID=2005166 RepID=UPI003F34D23A
MTATRALNVVFAGGNGYPPQATGGVQSSTHHLATALSARGHTPSVLAPLYGEGWFGLRARMQLKLSGQGFVTDTGLGYPVHRAWFPERQVGALLRTARPDVAVVQCHRTVPIGQAFAAAGVPLVIYLRNVEFDELGGDPRDLPNARFIANSSFTARRYAEAFGIDTTVIPPIIDRSLYETKPEGNFVTFIGPVPAKGLDRAIEIATACPEIPFLFVESWLLSPEQRDDLHRRIADLPNIRFEHRTPDMKALFRRTRLLLAPSRWEEAWGRVASEAHCSGIPVVGSSRGGLAEAIGTGGTVLDYEAPLADWVAAVRTLWSEPAAYAKASAAARAYSLRPELDSERQFTTFLSILETAVQHRSAA